MKTMKKTIALLVAVSMIVGCVIGATLAWLTSTSAPVVNTFTTSDITVTLAESENLDLKMIPGHIITKDPKVTVGADSEDCYLFVKVEKSENYGQYLNDYIIADGWTALDGVTGVYYREVLKTDEDKAFDVLKDNQVSVKTNITKEMMNVLNETTYPTLTFTAYASQLYKSNVGSDVERTFTAEEAWNNAQPTTTP